MMLRFSNLLKMAQHDQGIMAKSEVSEDGSLIPTWSAKLTNSYPPQWLKGLQLERTPQQIRTILQKESRITMLQELNAFYAPWTKKTMSMIIY